MKKDQLFSTVLLLFLLVPASITWAQKISVKGNVYENNLVKTPVNAPQGEVIITLPDDVSAGEPVKGSVELQPAGNTAKEIANNLAQLQHFSIRFGDKTIPLNTASFSCLVPAGNNTSSPVDLLNASGKKIGVSQVPLLNMPRVGMTDYHFETPSTNLLTGLRPEKNILIAGENIAEYNLPAQPVNFYLSQQGKETMMNTVAASPRKEIIQLPQNISGPAQVICKDLSGKTLATQNIHVLNLSATCPKTNLMKGDQTLLTASIENLSGVPADYVKLTLENASAGNVKLGTNNYEELVLQTRGNNMSPKIDPATGIATIQRSVTALNSGPFVINLQLSYPSTVYNDPLKQQLDAIQNVNDLKAWQNAFLNDVGNTNISMELRTASGPQTDWSKMLVHDLRADPNWKEPVPQYRYDSLERKIKKTGDTWKTPVAPQDIEQQKAFTYAMVQSFHIPKAIVENYFSCTRVAGNIALENAEQAAANGTISYNEAVVNTALQNVQHNAAILKNEPVKRSATILLNDKTLSMQREILSMTQYLQAVQHIRQVTHDAERALVQNMKEPVPDRLAGPDPVNDLIGYLDPARKLLFTTAEDQQQVLHMVHAEPRPAGKYFIHSLNAERQPVSYMVDVVTGSSRDIFKSGIKADQANACLLNAKKSKRKEGPPGNLATPDTSYKDNNGTTFYFYKNADCYLYQKAAPGDCEEDYTIGSEPIPSMGPTAVHLFKKPNGQYFRIKFLETGKCYAGDGFCSAGLFVSEIKYIYKNKDCSGFLDFEKRYDYSCE